MCKSHTGVCVAIVTVIAMVTAGSRCFFLHCCFRAAPPPRLHGSFCFICFCMETAFMCLLTMMLLTFLFLSTSLIVASQEQVEY